MNTDEKIDKILEKVNEQNITLAKFLVHQQQHKKEIGENTNDIKKLTGFKDRILGIVVFISGAVSILGIIISVLIKH